ncbi:MAG: DUF937 domain-containing protein [Pseudomonadota bacterium]|nr:DUF937 domain-containing protein [Pseudomonadota bacterium]
MTLGQALDSAQRGNLFEKLARMSGLPPSDCRAALAGLGPGIAARIEESARDPKRFDELLDMLEDNEGDLLLDGDLESRDTEQDGQGVLASAYGSEHAARAEAVKTAKALRLLEEAVVRLMPVAAALVLAVLAKRHKELAGPLPEEEADAAPAAQPAGSARSGGVMSVLVGAIGAGIARAVANRFLPRRRRRYSYPRTGYSGSRGTARRRRRRQPTLEDVFRGLLR